ncbi:MULTISPECIES: molybdate ABC transporter substrate-binding protein [unclassified Hydrogenobaculum]|uniref:molybdate ABC transporter substrate-binding protein n=1 Tax=unclassified Hydrogenobaculum TaxID=2622382 RepID=UPI0001C50368|nr:MULTISPECIES: molybdate ABC transporter substrate-binding protein [unclassified Hydrogenobaculum]AEF19326.1 molybdenum ABC transporter, periplasmic molybdate-binding protein [Hydrogenobaculum sp. 3684]AEG46615.1 molybdenum ABC transporter, periplasmic molybdate-binding protein [Hydrogenobaculum sp. SHO]AGG15259.1 molybdenum ABC transporter, periplasmic molybdate-binding protein [Hydrogenobaculum sp. HO]AGH93561.1 molybdenum ABC transporter, periplasmic molybdate-binding protein [Hydrogenobac
MVNLACAPNLEGIIDKITVAANIPTIVTIGENCLVYQRSLISSAEKPYDIFLAADIESAKELVDLGIGSDLRIYARGRLCLFAFDKKPSLEDIEKAHLIAIPDPSVAPYGRATYEFLKNTNLLDEHKLIFGRNPKEVLKIHKDRKTDLAFLPLSFVLANLKSENYFELDISYYKPIEQAGVIVNRTNEAILLFDFITNSEFAKNIFKEYGL